MKFIRKFFPLLTRDLTVDRNLTAIAQDLSNLSIVVNGNVPKVQDTEPGDTFPGQIWVDTGS